MTDQIASLDPQPVWQYFAEMARVPRPSRKEEKIRAHMRGWAESHGFAVREDPTGNMVIEVPASKGSEDAPVTVLQGHLDMVCEKNAGTDVDFDNDPIPLRLDNDDDGATIVRAEGTTLGADNGIGVALAMAAATEPDVTRPPLEILCTADEEQGMTGAKQLDANFIKGRRMLNLDSEEDDAIYIGCAGGCDTTLTWALQTAAPPAADTVLQVTVSGLRGGHTGGDIHENRGNAIKLLVDTLRGTNDHGLQLAEIHGGSKRNAIPREASAVLVGNDHARSALEKAAQRVQKIAAETGEPRCRITIEPLAAPSAVAPAEDTYRVLTALTALPHGVLAVVPEIAGLVQTSNSVSTIETNLDNGVLRVIVGCLSRSSSKPQMDTAVEQLHAIGRLSGAGVESGNEYPGWAPNIDSPTLATCRRVYRDLFGEDPKVTAIHAGLECGLIGERMGPGTMDMVSFGPRIEGAHSPDERVWVDSVQKSWTYLKAVLAELARA